MFRGPNACLLRAISQEFAGLFSPGHSQATHHRLTVRSLTSRPNLTVPERWETTHWQKPAARNCFWLPTAIPNAWLSDLGLSVDPAQTYSLSTFASHSCVTGSFCSEPAAFHCLSR